jgi:ribosomal protein S18 acetylase RimI-like enzyme
LPVPCGATILAEDTIPFADSKAVPDDGRHEHGNEAPGDAMMPVHHLTASEIPKASQTLARAFWNDPLVWYFSPTACGRELLLYRFYRWLLRYGLLYGEVYAPSPGLEGVAMWLPPEANHGAILKMARPEAILLPFTVGPRFLLRSWRYGQHIGHLRHRHMPSPHWFLQLLGVDPDFQKQGHATSLLRSMLERLDRETIACCLDTGNRADVGFYQRFGFRVAEESHVPGTNVDCWLMVRAV